MTRILITTGLTESDIGGPFQYGPRLRYEFEKLGHKVRVVKYGSVEASILGIWRHAIWADKILALDTFSVGFSSVLAAKLFRRKVVIRVGGDFIWSAYVNRTREKLSLPEFYRNFPRLNVKEKVLFALSGWTIKKANFLAFNTEWQRNIWSSFYKIPDSKTGIVRNYIPEKKEGNAPASKNFLWAGRLIPEKNPKMLKKFGVDIVTGKSHEEVLDKIRNSYATVSFAWTDICPNFILEGISCDKPFIMTRETGLNEMFPKGGIFIDPLSEAEIEKAMKALLEKNIYNKYVDELKSLNLSHNWAKMAEEFIEIWKKI